MAPVEALDPQPDEKVLDLCAAPGGKTTQIAAKMKGTGWIVANEIDSLRVNTLSENIARLGVRNVTILNEKPESLRSYFKTFFDRILVDAPCSGEGMFRKNRETSKNWSHKLVEKCSRTQLALLEMSASLLRPGGTLVYSTCTFNYMENEEVIAQFSQNHPEFSLTSSQKQSHFSPGLDHAKKTSRLWPHHLDGEGYFFAVLKKTQNTSPREKKKKNPLVQRRGNIPCVQSFFKEIGYVHPFESFIIDQENVYHITEEFPSFKGLKVKHPGRFLGSIRKGHFIPSHALALSIEPRDVIQKITFASDDPQLKAYLQGETFPTTRSKGYKLITVDHYSLGWGKVSNGIVKNHYPKSLRWKEQWF